MNLSRAFLGGLLLASSTLFAGDYDSLFKTVKTYWPERKEAAVICDLEMSRFAVADIVAAARAAGISLQAVNVKSEKDVDKARSIINSARPGFIVLVDSDPILGPQGKQTKSFISSALNVGVPSVGTSGDFLKIGGAMAIGPKTSGKVLASGRLTKSLRLKVPEGTTLQ